MTILKTPVLTTQQLAEIKSLQKICFTLEDLENEPFLSNELNADLSLPCFFLYYENSMLVGFLQAFFPTKEEVEFNIFVHPASRRKGICTALADEARKTYENLSFLQILFQVEGSSKSGQTYIQKRYPTIDRTEYRMTLSKKRWQEKRPSQPTQGTLVEAKGEYRQLYIETATSLLREDAGFIERTMDILHNKSFLYLFKGNPIGVLRKNKEDEQFPMLYGVAIDEAYRGQGHGKAMLTLALDSFFEETAILSLEVDSQNPKAFGLYRGLGFEIDFQVAYHSLILS